MLSTIIKNTVKYWVDKKIINDTDIDIYEYGLELILSSVINIVIILIMGLCTRQLIQSIVMLAVVIPLQSCGGGYHAKTHLHCFLIMFIGWWGVMWIIPYINFFAAIIMLCISLVTIFVFAPVVNENVPMSELQFHKMKVLVRWLAVVGTVIGIAILLYGEEKQEIGNSLIMGMGVVVLSMIVAKVKQK